MKYDDYINYKNTITNKGKQLLEKLKNANSNYTDMCLDLTTITNAANNLFSKLDVAYPEDEEEEDEDIDELEL